MKTIKSFNISKESEGISLAHLDDVNKCYIGVNQYGEFTSCALNKTEVKKVIKWLNKWIEFKEEQ